MLSRIFQSIGLKRDATLKPLGGEQKKSKHVTFDDEIYRVAAQLSKQQEFTLRNLINEILLQTAGDVEGLQEMENFMKPESLEDLVPQLGGKDLTLATKFARFLLDDRFIEFFLAEMELIDKRRHLLSKPIVE